MKALLTVLLLSPLVSALCIGVMGRRFGRRFAHAAAIAGVALSLVLSIVVFIKINLLGESSYVGTLYQWLSTESYTFEVGFLVDALTSSMMLVVTFVSLLINIYTIGYMADDEDYEHDNPYYQRFFSYMALFTFAMLSLVMSNNFLQLFFGWEAVGLVSYLLIGFYTKRESATRANLKAFLVNRFGDLGFLLGIALIFMYFDTLNYEHLFRLLDGVEPSPVMNFFGWQIDVVTAICLLLFIGAMGKSAQMPLHVWLPDSMEGPTPISALIHAATMVTAGIYMVVRLSPLFELSEFALSFIMVVGATSAFLMGLIGIVQNDIKRIVAYSTLSQLGYMVAALGASAYAASFFHVFTHAFFKALLFLGCGCVIVALHHQQNIRNMGSLKTYMPITWGCMLVGSLSLVGVPGFAGFFSKETIILHLQHSTTSASAYAYYLLLGTIFITAFYSFRLLFLVFHGKQSDYVRSHPPKEAPKIMLIPLVLLAFCSIFAGLFIEPWIYGDFFGNILTVLPEHNHSEAIQSQYANGLQMFVFAPISVPFYLTVGGIFTAWYCYIKNPALPEIIAKKCHKIHNLLNNAYGFDRLYHCLFVRGSHQAGNWLWRVIDTKLIDKGIVNGIAQTTASTAAVVRHIQTGQISHYLFVMLIGAIALLGWLLLR